MKSTERMNGISLKFKKKKKEKKEKKRKKPAYYHELYNLKLLRDSQKKERNGRGKKNIKDIEKRGSAYNHPSLDTTGLQPLKS